MRTAEVVQLLARIAAGDNRQVDEAAARYWQDIVGDLDYRDAVEAVRQHRMASTDYLQPAHVRQGVKRIREQRIDAHLKEIPPYPNPDDVAGAIAHDKAWRRRLADGYEPPAPPAITAGAAPKVDHLTQAPPRSDKPKKATGEKSPLNVTCPWCHAEPGRPCVVNGHERHWPHSARQEAVSDTGEARRQQAADLEAARQRALRSLEAMGIEPVAVNDEDELEAGDGAR